MDESKSEEGVDDGRYRLNIGCMIVKLMEEVGEGDEIW